MLNNLLNVWATYTCEDNVLIYQLGKVGSSTLESSIKNSIHTHSLYGNPPCYVYMQQQRQGLKKLHGWLGDTIKRIALYQRKEVKIITLVRDPVDRNISMFFQDLAYWIYEYVGTVSQDTRTSEIDYLETVFEKSFDHYYINKWFDIELKRLTGIDVFQTPFPKDRGWVVIKQGKYSVLLIEASKLTSCEPVIGDFIGRKVVLQESNAGHKKWYASLYNQFKSSFDKNAYREKLKKTKYFKHFYG